MYWNSPGRLRPKAIQWQEKQPCGAIQENSVAYLDWITRLTKQLFQPVNTSNDKDQDSERIEGCRSNNGRLKTRSITSMDLMLLRQKVGKP